MRPMFTSFNGGEWSPLLEGRIELEKYGSSLFRLENFLLDPRGPAMVRPGLRYIAGTKTNAKKSRLIPFEFSATQAYMLEFGDLYIRFFKNKAQITSSGNPYEIASPYLEADLTKIKYCQSADVIYLFHPSYAPRKLSRAGDTNWTLTTINFRPAALSQQAISPAATLSLHQVSGNEVSFTTSAGVFQTGDIGRLITSGAGRASITAFSSSSHVDCEIIDAFSTVGPIASGSWSMHGSPNGNLDPSVKSPVGGIVTLSCADAATVSTDLLGIDTNYWTLTASDAGRYYLQLTAPGYTSVKPTKVVLNGISAVEAASIASMTQGQWAWGNADSLGGNTIYVRLTDDTDPDTKSTAANPEPHYVRREATSGTLALFRTTDVGKYIRIHSGLVKITSYISASSVNGEIVKELTADTATASWTLESDVWTAGNGFPSCGAFFEERFVMAGSTANPETVWGSVVGDYENFTPGIADADAFEFTLSGRQVNSIRWLESREYLVVGTVGGEWRIGPEDSGDSLTPLNVVAKQVRNYGSADMLPVTTAGATLFVQRAGRKVRELTYQWETNGYTAPDLTLLAEHVTAGGIAGMAYQQEPFSILWIWLNDGSLIGLTYLREHDVIGWHKHPISGSIESLATIPGTGYDEVWAVVKRTVNGATVRYVEMLEAVFTDTAAQFASNKGLNAFFVDSGITYNGAATTTITGLSHLEGQTVAGLADGSVFTGKTVTGGQITLATAASVVHVGLPYTGTLQTNRLDISLQDGTSQGRLKKVSDVTVRVVKSGVFKVGPDTASLTACFDKEQNVILGQAPPLFSGDIRSGYDGGWEKDSRIMVVQDKPLPLTVAAIIPEVDIRG